MVGEEAEEEDIGFMVAVELLGVVVAGVEAAAGVAVDLALAVVVLEVEEPAEAGKELP
ncbi:MAG: hypothetical protein RL335_123 [Bacteroidota bacterium]